MCEKIVVTSGKGGVGKTTFVLNLGITLARKGKRVVLIDFDFGLNNLDVVSGVENLVVFDLIDVMNYKCRVKQALVKCPFCENLFVLPTTHTLQKNFLVENVKEIIADLEVLFDYIIIDCPAGIDVGFHRAISYSTYAICITTPHLSSIRDADKVISILKSYRLKGVKVVVNRVRGDLVLSGDMFSYQEIESTLLVEVLGVLPEDDLLNTSFSIMPNTQSEKAYKIICDNLLNGDNKIYDCFKKYRGFFGSIRKELKRRL